MKQLEMMNQQEAEESRGKSNLKLFMYFLMFSDLGNIQTYDTFSINLLFCVA